VSRRWSVAVRVAGLVALLALLGVCVSDFETDFWVDHAMLTAVLSALLIAIVARARRQLLGEDWVAEGIAKVIDLAAHLELEFNAAARALAPLEHWTGPPEWYRPPSERVSTPTG
jgi:hypothetical protein